MRIACLASGSRANSFIIDSGKTKILVDAGLSCKRTCERLSELNISIRDLSGILISHEHSDHIAGLSVINKRFQIPIFFSDKTVSKIKNVKDLKNIYTFKTGSDFNIGDIDIMTIPVHHDAFDPSAFILESSKKKIGVATDLGKVNHNLRVFFNDLDLMIIESNHDTDMLMKGKYSWPLKKRIASHHGHLSNDDAAVFISEVYTDRLQKIMLAHLSKENNLPSLAYSTVNSYLEEKKLVLPIEICSQDISSPWTEIL